MSQKHFTQTVSFAGATIEYRSFDLASVKLEFDQELMSRPIGAVRVVKVIIDGDAFKYSERFGISFATLLKQSPSIFMLFDVGEVIDRALARKKVFGQAVLTIARTNPADPVALAVAPFSKRFFTLTHLERFMGQLKGAHLARYAGDGTFTMDYDLAVVHRPVEVKGLTLFPSLNMRLSIDGWGRPVAWLAYSIGRGGARILAMADAFRTSANIGEESGKYVAALARFTRSFSNEEGFGAMHSRLEAAYHASASLAEFMDFEKAVNNSHLTEKARKVVATLAHEEAVRFGLTSLSVVSKKRTVRVPSRFSVADLLFMAAELSHKESEGDSKALYSWIGSTLAEEGGFDLEGTLDDARPVKLDFFSQDMVDTEATTPAETSRGNAEVKVAGETGPHLAP